MPKLTHLQDTFVKEYVKNGFNATQAYLKAHPGTKLSNASQYGSELIRKPQVHCEIEALKHKGLQSSPHNRENLLKRAYKYEEMAASAHKLHISLNSIDLQAKLNGLYNDITDKGQFDQLIQACQININVNQVEDNQDKSQEIEADITESLPPDSLDSSSL
jgi:hypothetical protein